MTTAEQSWIGHQLDAADATKVGRIVGIVRGEGEASLWLHTRLGRFGHHTAVPAADAVEGVGCVWVPYTREVIRGAPSVEPRETLDADAERELRRRYEID